MEGLGRGALLHRGADATRSFIWAASLPKRQDDDGNGPHEGGDRAKQRGPRPLWVIACGDLLWRHSENTAAPQTPESLRAHQGREQKYCEVRRWRTCGRNEHDGGGKDERGCMQHHQRSFKEFWHGRFSKA